MAYKNTAIVVISPVHVTPSFRGKRSRKVREKKLSTELIDCSIYFSSCFEKTISTNLRTRYRLKFTVHLPIYRYTDSAKIFLIVIHSPIHSLAYRILSLLGQTSEMSSKISKMKSGFYNTFIKSNALLPNEFFDIRDDRVLKTKNMPLVYGLTSLIYGITAAVFIALFVTQSQSYNIETSITTKDKSNDPRDPGRGSYTCSMASVVTKTVTLGTTAQFTSDIHLSAINELYPQCVADMKKADPCSSPANFLFNADGLVQWTGDTVMSPSAGREGFVSVSGSGQFFYGLYLNPNDFAPISRPFKYNLITGDIQFDASHATEYVVTDKKGNAYFLDKSTHCLVSFTPEFKESDCSFTNKDPVVLNDNNHDIYYITLSFNTNELSFQQQYHRVEDETEISILSQSAATAFAIRNQNSKNKDDINFYFDYYTTSQETPQRGVTVYNHFTKISQNLITFCRVPVTDAEPYDVGKPQVDPSGNFLYCVSDNYDLIQFDLLVGEQLHILSPEKSSVQVFSFSIMNKDLVLISLHDKDQNNYRLAVYNQTAVHSQIHETNLTIIRQKTFLKIDQYLYTGFTGSHVGFFTCGSRIMPEFKESSSLLYKYCPANGIFWDMSVTKSSKLLTKANARTGFVTDAQAYCLANSTVETACGEVKDLPPYICSRNVYLPIFTVLSTAIANSATVLGFLLLIFGAFIGKFSDFADTHGCKSRADIDPNQNDSSRKYFERVPKENVEEVRVETMDLYMPNSDFQFDDDRLPTESNPDPRAHAYFEVDGGVEAGFPPDNDVVK
jgi:hypothetical protein